MSGTEVESLPTLSHYEGIGLERLGAPFSATSKAVNNSQDSKPANYITRPERQLRTAGYFAHIIDSVYLGKCLLCTDI